MSKNNLISWVAGMTVLLAIMMFVAAALLGDANDSRPSVENAGSMESGLVFITAIAVAIERLIELIWTAIGSTAGTYWPLNIVARQLSGQVDELNMALKPIQVQIESKLKNLQAEAKISEADFLSATNEITRLHHRLDEMAKLPLDNQRIQLLIASASTHVDYVTKKYGALVDGLGNAQVIVEAAISGLREFTATFTDNPGRRLISIYLGMIFGLVVACVFELNIFQTILSTNSPHFVAQIISTGLVIGLGSSPTHEVIRAVQEYKKSKKGQVSEAN
jgi:hypothetical protein